jgi:hypothetical protein
VVFLECYPSSVETGDLRVVGDGDENGDGLLRNQVLLDLDVREDVQVVEG